MRKGVNYIIIYINNYIMDDYSKNELFDNPCENNEKKL